MTQLLVEGLDPSWQPAPPMLECLNIDKSFGGVPVLRDVSLSLVPGTITALAGENGAGKSTLMKIASGQYRPDAGTVLVRGEVLPHGDTQAAHQLGVAIVPQELASVMDQTVYENLFLGREIKGRWGLNRGEMIRQARTSLEVFGVDIKPTAMMRELSVGLRQVVEIVKAINTGARVILLDEPSSAIARQEVERLFAVVRTLRDQGVAILLTTHKMEEIRALADRVVVLRDGGLVIDKAINELTDDDIVTAMIGRELTDLFPDLPAHEDGTVLQVQNLVLDAPGAVPISFEVKAGEIVGLAGLVGAGRTELLEGIFGIRPTTAGEIFVQGQQVKRGDPVAAIAANIAFVPEDRKGAGLVLCLDVIDNTSLPRLNSFTSAGVLNQRKRRESVKAATESVRLRSRGLNQTVETLSGGNQQKVAVARWLTGNVDVLLLDEPTRGVDVGARSEIYRIITSFAEKGMAVVMASSDMPEILSLSHRAYVLREGHFVGELDATELASPLAQDQIFRLASGISAGAEQPPTAPQSDPTNETSS